MTPQEHMLIKLEITALSGNILASHPSDYPDRKIQANTQETSILFP